MAPHYASPDERQTDHLAGMESRSYWLAEAVNTLTPYAQGAFDGFCGLYTLINALRLMFAETRPLTFADSKALFRCGIRFLERKDWLIVGGFGMPMPWWHELADDIAAAASLMFDRPVTIERPFDHHDIRWAEVFARIVQLVDAQLPVMLVLRGAYRHHSIVTGYSRTRLRLFDSAGRSWVNIASCCTTVDDVYTRYCIPPTSLAVLRLGTQHDRRAPRPP